MEPTRPADLQPLPPASLHVLVALSRGSRHGYAIMNEVEELTDGAVTMGPGTLYGTLKRLDRDGLVEECDGPADSDPGGPQRRYYRLTGFGQRVLDAETARLRNLLRATQRSAGHPSPGRAS